MLCPTGPSSGSTLDGVLFIDKMGLVGHRRKISTVVAEERTRKKATCRQFDLSCDKHRIRIVMEHRQVHDPSPRGIRQHVVGLVRSPSDTGSRGTRRRSGG